MIYNNNIIMPTMLAGLLLALGTNYVIKFLKHG